MIKASFSIIDYSTDVHEHALVSQAIIGTGVILGAFNNYRIHSVLRWANRKRCFAYNL